MFYNCQSLTSFSFNKLYLDFYGYNYKEYPYRNFRYLNCPDNKEHVYHYDCYYYIGIDNTYKLYNKISMAYIFYNCTSLKFIDIDSNQRQNISDMKYMFYNCISL